MRATVPEPALTGAGVPGVRARIPGIDVARGLALLGMFAVHLLPLENLGPDGVPEPSWAALLFAGKASTLFAVLAGTGLALLSGGAVPHTGPRLAAVRRSVAVRALAIAALGMVLASLEAPVAIILVHYGLFFLAALPFLGLGARALAGWAGAWLLLAPWLLAILDALLSPGQLETSPGFTDLADPRLFLEDLLMGGYYPVLLWTGFILLGLCLGRLPLNRPSTAAWLFTGGTVLALGARFASAWLVSLPGAMESLARAAGTRTTELGAHLRSGSQLGGISDSGWFMAIDAPHSGAPLDVLLTAGSAVAVLGACQLLALGLGALEFGALRRGRALVVLWPLAGAGAATLTLYSAHLVALHYFPLDESALPAGAHLAIYVLVALGFGLLLKILGRRGPLEAGLHALALSVTGPPSGTTKRGRLD